MIVTVYHGTTLDNAHKMKEIGARDLFVTTSVDTARHYGIFHCHFGKELAVIKIKTNLDKLYWATTSCHIIRKARLVDLRDELNLPIRVDNYLLVKGKIIPKDITLVKKPVMIRKIMKEQSKYFVYPIRKINREGY